jgi:hypothetical protein
MAVRNPARQRKLVSLALVLVAGGGAAGWISSRHDPMADAVDEALHGDADNGCASLRTLLSQPMAEQATLHPHRRPEGWQQAERACVDRSIDHALAQSDPAAREAELLTVASPSNPLRLSSEQAQRIENAVAGIPGAIDDGKGRLRAFSYEVSGPLAIKHARNTLKALALPLRGCHAEASLAEPKSELGGSMRLRLRVAADGQVKSVASSGAATSRTSDDGELKSATLDRCLKRLLAGQRLPAAERGSIVTVGLIARPFGAAG